MEVDKAGTASGCGPEDPDLERTDEAQAETSKSVELDAEKNPWPHLGDFFLFKHRKGNSIIMQCK